MSVAVQHHGHRLDVLPCPGGGSRGACSCGRWRGPQRLTRAQAWADRPLWEGHIGEAPALGTKQKLVRTRARTAESAEKHRAGLRASWARRREQA